MMHSSFKLLSAFLLLLASSSLPHGNAMPLLQNRDAASSHRDPLTGSAVVLLKKLQTSKTSNTLQSQCSSFLASEGSLTATATATTTTTLGRATVTVTRTSSVSSPTTLSTATVVATSTDTETDWATVSSATETVTPTVYTTSTETDTSTVYTATTTMEESLQRRVDLAERANGLSSLQTYADMFGRAVLTDVCQYVLYGTASVPATTTTLTKTSTKRAAKTTTTTTVTLLQPATATATTTTTVPVTETDTSTEYYLATASPTTVTATTTTYSTVYAVSTAISQCSVPTTPATPTYTGSCSDYPRFALKVVYDDPCSTATGANQFLTTASDGDLYRLAMPESDSDSAAFFYLDDEEDFYLDGISNPYVFNTDGDAYFPIATQTEDAETVPGCEESSSYGLQCNGYSFIGSDSVVSQQLNSDQSVVYSLVPVSVC